MARAKKEGDLYIASMLHVARGSKKVAATAAAPAREETVVKTIDAGQMVSDTDLTADEIKEFKARGVLRYATPEEQAAMDSKADREEAAQAEAEAGTDAELLRQRHAAERATLEATQKAEATKAAQDLADEQAKEVAHAGGATTGKATEKGKKK
jgi:hypothetical protein